MCKQCYCKAAHVIHPSTPGFTVSLSNEGELPPSAAPLAEKDLSHASNTRLEQRRWPLKMRPLKMSQISFTALWENQISVTDLRDSQPADRLNVITAQALCWLNQGQHPIVICMTSNGIRKVPVASALSAPAELWETQHGPIKCYEDICKGRGILWAMICGVCCKPNLACFRDYQHLLSSIS